jgi:leader peptidase (prepilin peptidase)/N-methyltransferase
MIAGFLCSFLVPVMHSKTALTDAMRESLMGLVFGAGLIYFILRLGKLFFGRQTIELPADSRVLFTETALILPDREIPYEDLFYRKSDTIIVHAAQAELVDRCYRDVRIRLSPARLQIGEEKFNPEEVPHLEATSNAIVLPREAMGFGDVKFMGAIGAFLGWQAVIFSLMVSSIIGSIVGVGLILAKKQAWSARLPYGPYIAVAAALWIFGGKTFVTWWFNR